MVPEALQRSHIGGHSVVGKIAAEHCSQPPALLVEWSVHVRSQLILDRMQSCSHAISPRRALELERPTSRTTANEDETEKRERFGSVESSTLSPFGGIAPKLDQPRLLPVQFKLELLESRPHGIPETSGIRLVLEAEDDIIGVADDDASASSLSSAPSVGPEVEDIVQKHVGQER